MEDDLNDDFVASLLKKEAVDKTSRYSAAGLQAFLPRRSTTNAPKPNTRFLRNIVREADSHNAALRSKELADSRSRLRNLHNPEPQQESSRHHSPRYSASEAAERAKRKRSRSRSPHRDRYRERRERHRRSDRASSGRSRDRDHHRSRRRREGRSKERKRRERSRSGSGEDSTGKDLENTRFRRRRRGSRERGNDGGYSMYRNNGESLADTGDPINTKKQQKSRRRRSLSSSSDPLDEIIGPAPPSPAPLARGRGVPRGQAAIDSHFNESYDPSQDVRLDSEEGDDWENAMEAYRDRQKWKSQGADRLRSAGFGEQFIEAWENNNTKNEINLKWAGKGSTREWDRGKVVESETGEVNLRAEWARKGSTKEWDRGKVEPT